jgi:broad specificity phosphatase PhoE
VTVHVYVTHPQVRIDPAVPVPRWSLSDIGRQRAERAAQLDWAAGIRRIVSSDETKAIETARIFADRLGLAVEIHANMHENDRSATGFLPPPEFEETADLFFAHPEQSVRGWERAVDAQQRIVAAVDAALAERPELPTAFIGHGGVGTLLYCRLAGLEISRRHDQGPGGGGNYFAFERDPARVLHAWRRIDAAL